MKIRLVCLLLALLGLVIFSSAVAAKSTITDSAPIQVAPSDGLEVTYLSHPPLAIPTFEWQPVEGTTGYELWIARDVTFNDKLVISTANTRYTPARSQLAFLLDSTDQFYWRVRVSKPTLGEWSNGGMPWTFSKKWGTPSADPPNAPQLLSPDEGDALQFFDTPVFSWTPITGTAYYRLEIARDVDFTNIALTQSNLPFPTFQPLQKLSNGDYYWRVTPFDVANHSGATSSTRRFKMSYGEDPFDAPKLIAPEDGSLPTFTPTFEWEAMNGARVYRLQYSTDETFLAPGTVVNTRSTSYTPDQLPNDVNYYWRVRAISGASQSSWSEVRSFEKHWYIQPKLLTPTSSYQHVSGQPLFSWTPVPGAGYYVLEWARDQNFLVGRSAVQVMHTYYLPYNRSFEADDTWFWRVTPYHSGGHAGIPSATRSFSRDMLDTGLVPDLIYPAFFYEPDARFSAHEHVSAALPIFAWSRIIEGQDFVGGYEIQVDRDPLFGSPDFQQTTTNSIVVPDWTTPFVPTEGVDYYWRVRSIDRDGFPRAWSQRWLTQFDFGLGLLPSEEDQVQLLRPVDSSQGIETIPLLEWWPVEGASAYTVTLATDPEMTDVVFSASAQYPAYAYTEMLPYDTYYWQVQASDGTALLGEPSEVWRFQIAAQDRWRVAQPEPMITSTYTKTLVAEDEIGDAAPDLANLYVANDASYWHFGFDVDTAAAQYLILIDVDRLDGQGAPSDPEFGLPVITAHRPEYAILIPREASVPTTGGFDVSQAAFYEYGSGAWLTPQSLLSVGGNLFYTDTLTSTMVLDGFLQVQVELGLLGAPGTVAIQVVALNNDDQVVDTLPPSREGELDGFVSISEEVMPIAPPTNTTGDPRTHAHIPVIRWHPHVDADVTSYGIQIARDPEFSAIVRQASGFRWYGYTVENGDLDGDNTYYWHARVIHEGGYGGPYNSHPWRFDRRGLIPRAPEVEMLGSSVTFSWDKVAGTDRYLLEWSTDPNFGSSSTANVRSWQHTPQALLAPGTYYWRVRVRQWQGEQNGWSQRGVFTVVLPIPDGLVVEPPGTVVPRTPTLMWSPYLTPTETPRFSAWRYNVQVCRDQNMTDGCQSAVTEQYTWTPPSTFAEGALYWRARLMDGSGRYGEWTELPPVTNLITKQYPAPTLVSPTVGASLDATPTFMWEAVNTMAYYRVEISQDELFSRLYDSVETAATEYTPLKVYDTAQYYWRVCVRDKDGRQGPCTDSIILLDPWAYSVFLPLTVRD